MYDFLNPKLMPKVTCSAPATDNFEATNLISEKEAIRVRGFMAYTVIRPPVELDFEFLCPIEAHFVVLQTTLGRQKCTGIELLAKSNTSSYVSIGKAVYDSPSITFCDSQKYSKANPPSHHDSSNALFFFKKDTVRVFRDLKCLKVVIFKTDKSVPCLGSIKVFGMPSKSCSQVTIETIDKLMGRRQSGANEITKSEENVDIPKDFLDDLTCEIMAVPMTLPSGKTVDRDTLEKHVENEKSFGRKPCDPFTGLKFTETRKPLMNVALKSRIDMFLMQNSTQPFTYGLKRTSGNDNTISKRVKSELKCCQCQNNQNLYVIPCRHFYCRNCLVNLEEWKCNSCRREFSRSEPKKHHIPSL